MNTRTRASAVCVYEDELLCVTLRDPVTRVANLYVPGGKVERGESPAAAAARETLEETGYVVKVDQASEAVVRYPFVWAGGDVDVTTHFFRAHLSGPKSAPVPVDDADYNEGVVWLALRDVKVAFEFHEAILHAVRALLAHGIIFTGFV